MEKIKIFIYKIQYISSASKETENIKRPRKTKISIVKNAVYYVLAQQIFEMRHMYFNKDQTRRNTRSCTESNSDLKKRKASSITKIRRASLSYKNITHVNKCMIKIVQLKYFFILWKTQYNRGKNTKSFMYVI